MAINKPSKTALAHDVAQCCVTMAAMHRKPVQVFASPTKILFIIDGGDEHLHTPDYVGTYKGDGISDLQSHLLDHWRK